MAGTWPARRRRRLAPLPWSVRPTAAISWICAIDVYLQLRDSASRRMKTLPRPGESCCERCAVKPSAGPPVTAHLIHIQRTDRLPVRHATQGFGQQFRDGQLADLAAGRRRVGQLNGVGHHQFVHLRILDVVDRPARQHRVRAVGDNLFRAALLQRTRSRAQRARGIHDVVHQNANLVLHIADDVHHRRFVGARPALVDDRQIRIVQPFRHRARAHHAADIRAHHDQVVVRVMPPDVGQQHRGGIHVVQRNVEEALYLVGVDIDRQHAIRAYHADHLRRHFRGDRYTRRAQTPVLPRVAEVRNHRGDAGRRSALQRVHQHQQLHQIFRRRRAGGLHHEHILLAHVLFDLDLYLAVRKLSDQRLAQRLAQTMRHVARQLARSVAAEEHQAGSCIHVTASSIPCLQPPSVKGTTRSKIEPGLWKQSTLTRRPMRQNLAPTHIVAGAAGFEPANAGIKTRCLTTWRRPTFDRDRASCHGAMNAVAAKPHHAFRSTLRVSRRYFHAPDFTMNLFSALNANGRTPALRAFVAAHPCALVLRCGTYSIRLRIIRIRPNASSSGDTFTPCATMTVNSAGQRIAISRTLASSSHSRNTAPPLPDNRATPNCRSQSSAAATCGKRARTTGSKALSSIVPETKPDIVAGSALRVNSGAWNSSAVETCTRGATSRYQRCGNSSGVSLSPMPSAQALRPCTKTGTSAPRPEPISANRSRGNPVFHSAFNATSTVAASELPPPSPAPIGMRLVTAISAPNCVPVTRCNVRAARTARSSSAETDCAPATRTISSSSRTRSRISSPHSSRRNTVCKR